MPVSDPAGNVVSAEEEAYLLAIANTYFTVRLGRADIVWRFAGVRPLLEGLGRAQEAEDQETGLRLAAALVDAYRADPTVADVVRELTGGVPDWLRE